MKSRNWIYLAVFMGLAGVAGFRSSGKVAGLRAEEIARNVASPYTIDYADQMFDATGKRVGESRYTEAERSNGDKVVVRDAPNGHTRRSNNFVSRGIAVFSTDANSNISTLGAGKTLTLTPNPGCANQHTNDTKLDEEVFLGHTAIHSVRSRTDREQHTWRAGQELDCVILKIEVRWKTKGVFTGAYTTKEALRIVPGEPVEGLFRLPEKTVEMTPYNLGMSIDPTINYNHLRRMEARYWSDMKTRNGQ